MTLPPPGYYPAAGDPPGTVRHWDGAQWIGDPMPPPPGWVDPAGPPAQSRFGNVGWRILAVVIDTVITMLFVLPFIWSSIGEIFDQVEAGVPQDELVFDVSGGLYVMTGAILIVNLLLTAYAGGTIGKLLVGLRITAEDGKTCPPGMRRALRRLIPGLVQLIPVIGPLLSLGLIVGCVAMVATDAERRSIYDRIAGTRVVYARELA